MMGCQEQCSEHCQTQCSSAPSQAMHVRTYGRTNVLTDRLEIDSPVRYRAESVEIGHRFPVVRTGERGEIPQYVRRAVYMRDDYACRICGLDLRQAPKNLDHLVPWSAGGKDTSDNLRTTCPPCNEHRSNVHDDAGLRRITPVTWWCTRCWSEPGWDLTDPDRHDPRPIETTRIAPPRFQVEDPTTQLAYCATCRQNGYTAVVL